MDVRFFSFLGPLAAGFAALVVWGCASQQYGPNQKALQDAGVFAYTAIPPQYQFAGPKAAAAAKAQAAAVAAQARINNPLPPLVAPPPVVIPPPPVVTPPPPVNTTPTKAQQAQAKAQAEESVIQGQVAHVSAFEATAQGEVAAAKSSPQATNLQQAQAVVAADQATAAQHPEATQAGETAMAHKATVVPGSKTKTTELGPQSLPASTEKKEMTEQTVITARENPEKFQKEEQTAQSALAKANEQLQQQLSAQEAQLQLYQSALAAAQAQLVTVETEEAADKAQAQNDINAAYSKAKSHYAATEFNEHWVAPKPLTQQEKEEEAWAYLEPLAPKQVSKIKTQAYSDYFSSSLHGVMMDLSLAFSYMALANTLGPSNSSYSYNVKQAQLFASTAINIMISSKATPWVAAHPYLSIDGLALYCDKIRTESGSPMTASAMAVVKEGYNQLYSINPEAANQIKQLNTFVEEVAHHEGSQAAASALSYWNNPANQAQIQKATDWWTKHGSSLGPTGGASYTGNNPFAWTSAGINNWYTNNKQALEASPSYSNFWNTTLGGAFWNFNQSLNSLYWSHNSTNAWLYLTYSYQLLMKPWSPPFEQQHAPLIEYVFFKYEKAVYPEGLSLLSAALKADFEADRSSLTAQMNAGNVQYKDLYDAWCQLGAAINQYAIYDDPEQAKIYLRNSYSDGQQFFTARGTLPHPGALLFGMEELRRALNPDKYANENILILKSMQAWYNGPAGASGQKKLNEIFVRVFLKPDYLNSAAGQAVKIDIQDAWEQFSVGNGGNALADLRSAYSILGEQFKHPAAIIAAIEWSKTPQEQRADALSRSFDYWIIFGNNYYSKAAQDIISAADAWAPLQNSLKTAQTVVATAQGKVASEQAQITKTENALQQIQKIQQEAKTQYEDIQDQIAQAKAKLQVKMAAGQVSLQQYEEAQAVIAQAQQMKERAQVQGEAKARAGAEQFAEENPAEARVLKKARVVKKKKKAAAGPSVEEIAEQKKKDEQARRLKIRRIRDQFTSPNKPYR